MGSIPPVAVGFGGGGLYRLGPETNAFATAAARDTYAHNENNATWLRRYMTDRRLATIQGAAGDAGPYYAVSGGTLTDRIWVLENSGLQAYDAGSGARESGSDIPFSVVSQDYTAVQSAAANSTRIYVIFDNTAFGSTVSHIRSFGHDGTHHATEDIALGNAPGANSWWTGVACTETHIYALWNVNNASGGVRQFTVAGVQGTDQTLAGFTSARDIAATDTRFRILSTHNNGAILSYTAAWVYTSSENVTLPSGGWTGISEHGGELFVLGSGGISVYTVPPSGAPVPSGRTIHATGRGLAARYDANVTWVQVLGTGVAGATGPRGAAGSDATVNSANVTAAIVGANTTQDTSIRSAINVEDGATADQTGAEMVTALEGQPAGQRLGYGYLDDEPDLSNYRTATQIGQAIQDALEAAVTGNTETNITVTYASGKYNFVVSGGGQQPSTPSAHTRYAAISSDTTFAAAEFTTSGTGSSSTTDIITLPTWTGDRYIGFAIPDDQPDLTDVHPNGGFNEIGSFTRISGTITINGVAYKVWRTTEIGLPANSGTTWDIS